MQSIYFIVYCTTMTHPNNGTVIKLRIEKCIHKYTFFSSQFHVRGRSGQSIQFFIGSLTNSNDMSSNFDLLSKVTPSSFFEFELWITVSDISKLNALVVLRSKSHLGLLSFRVGQAK